jgi:hypothetical protein
VLGFVAAVVLGLLAAALAAVFGGRWAGVGFGAGVLLLSLGLKTVERIRSNRTAPPLDE